MVKRYTEEEMKTLNKLKSQIYRLEEKIKLLQNASRASRYHGIDANINLVDMENIQDRTSDRRYVTIELRDTKLFNLLIDYHQVQIPPLQQEIAQLGTEGR